MVVKLYPMEMELWPLKAKLLMPYIFNSPPPLSLSGNLKQVPFMNGLVQGIQRHWQLILLSG